MLAVNSFSHQTGNPLAWSPGSEEGRKEKVGCARGKEVSSRGRCGGVAAQCWGAAEVVMDWAEFLGFVQTGNLPFGMSALGIQLSFL